MTEKHIIITDEEYMACLAPVRPPTITELFEYERAILAEKKLAPIDLFDRFATQLPASGLFLLVPPQPAPVAKLNWNELMARVELDGKRGKNYLVPQHLKDLLKVPQTPTMLVGVEDGRARVNIRPKDSRKAIPREGRHAYSIWRGFIHVLLFPVVLWHHGLDLVGSRSKSDLSPFLYLYGGGPVLNHGWESGTSSDWGAPSCGSVVGI